MYDIASELPPMQHFLMKVAAWPPAQA